MTTLLIFFSLGIAFQILSSKCSPFFLLCSNSFFFFPVSFRRGFSTFTGIVLLSWGFGWLESVFFFLLCVAFRMVAISPLICVGKGSFELEVVRGRLVGIMCSVCGGVCLKAI